MQVTSLVQIVGGELLLAPSISFVYDIKTKASQIKDGDAIISNNSGEILKAIENGAFCVIFSEDNIQSKDPEIAWIRVQDIQKAIISIARYLLSNLKIKSFYCDKLTLEMLQIYKKLDKKVVFLDNNIQKNFEKIKIIESNYKVFSDNKPFITQILPQTKSYSCPNYSVKNVVEHSLFEVSFSYKTFFIQRLKLPLVYLKNFIDAIEFYGFENMDLNKLKRFKHLNPYFINKNYEIVDFGKSNRFIIAQNEIDFLRFEMGYLEARFTYGKKIFLLPQSLENSLKSSSVIFYNSKEEIKHYISHCDYNCLYIYGIDELEIQNFLEPCYKSLELF